MDETLLFNLEGTAGQPFSFNYTWEIDDVPVDLTGMACVMEIKKDPTEESPVLFGASTSEVEGMGDITVDETGVTDILIPGEITENIEGGWYQYSITYTTLTNSSYTKLSGIFHLQEG